MAGHEIEKGEVHWPSPTERLHNDMRKKNEEQIQRDTAPKEEDCTDQYFECVSECDINDTECETVCVEELKECELPWEEEMNMEAPFDTPAYQNYRELIMTSEEDKFMHMDEGELISECLQIAALLGGTCTRTSTVDSSGRESKKIIIEYDIQRRNQEASKET